MIRMTINIHMNYWMMSLWSKLIQFRRVKMFTIWILDIRWQFKTFILKSNLVRESLVMFIRLFIKPQVHSLLSKRFSSRQFYNTTWLNSLHVNLKFITVLTIQILSNFTHILMTNIMFSLLWNMDRVVCLWKK